MGKDKTLDEILQEVKGFNEEALAEDKMLKDLEATYLDEDALKDGALDAQALALLYEKKKLATEMRRELIKSRIDLASSDKVQFIHAKPTPKIQDSDHKRVAVYARVSTKSLDQTSSIENQTRYYREKIEKNPNWELVEIYSDEGMENNNENNAKTSNIGISLREREIVREFAKAKMEANSELHFEDLNDYEIPPRTQFSMLNKPAVSIKYKEMTFNMASIRLFEGITQILPSLSKNKKRLAIIMRKEEGGSTVQWARKKGDHYVNKKITSLEFVDAIYNLMGWDKKRRYKALGRVADSVEGLILVFDLEEAIMFSELPEEYVDRRTGEIKKRKFSYYPDMYKGRVGRTYSEYIALEQVSMFENLDDYGDPEGAPVTGGSGGKHTEVIAAPDTKSEAAAVVAVSPEVT